MEHGATRAGVTVRREHVGVFTVSGEHAAVIACDRGGLRATSVSTADGAVGGIDTVIGTVRVRSGDS